MLEKSHGPVGELVIDWLGGFNHCRRSYNLFFFFFISWTASGYSLRVVFPFWRLFSFYWPRPRVIYIKNEETEHHSRVQLS